MRSIFWTFRGTAVLWAVLAIVGLFLGGCSQPNGGDTTTTGVTFTTPAQYREMALATPSANASVTITGNSAYYYQSSPDYYKGVFVENRTVTLSPFRIAKYETTYELWYEVYQWATDSEARGANVYTFANAGREGYDGTIGDPPTTAKTEPVTYINWRDAVIWCNAYSEMSGKEPVYYTDAAYNTVLKTSTNDTETSTAADGAVMKTGANGYRLPTEAEWEYAARGGGTPSPTGSFAYKWAGTNTESALKEYAWYDVNSYSLGNTHPDYGTHSVGTRTANGAGLKDMSGNVWEWCWDWYDTIGTGPATDPTGPASGSSRVVRGGSWFSFASSCAVADRYDDYPYGRSDRLGLRVVCGN